MFRIDRLVRVSMLAAAGLALAFSPARPAVASHCCDEWDQPFVCAFDFVAPGHVTGPENGGPWTVRLQPGKEIRVGVEARDQNGHDYPGSEIRYEIDADECHRLAAVEVLSGEHFVVKAGGRTGACALDFWVPGNRNLNTEIRVEIVTAHDPGALQAEIVAVRLYRAILGRDPSDSERRALGQTIERGGTGDWVEGAFRSQEFQSRRSRHAAEKLLVDIYKALLERDPDASGRSSYEPLMAQGRYADVVLSILRSREFRESLANELQD